jgi:hypothetical protein
MAILKMFNFDINTLLRVGGQVNTPVNVLTMSMVMHVSFDELLFWFEEVDGQVCLYRFFWAPPAYSCLQN